MLIEDFHEEFGTDIRYRLRGRILAAATTPRRGVLFFVPGARANLEDMDILVLPLVRLGYHCMNFELSGHASAAGIPPQDTSLAANLEEAERFLARITTQRPVLLGHSLGGALALKLAERHSDWVRRLILFGPAVYPESAYDVAFGENFRRELLRPFGFLSSSTFSFLHRYAGRMLLILGEYDGLPSTDHDGVAGRSAGQVRLAHGEVYSAITAQVVQALCDASAPDQLERITLPGCDHALSSNLRDRPGLAQDLMQHIDAFLFTNPRTPDPRLLDTRQLKAPAMRESR